MRHAQTSAFVIAVSGTVFALAGGCTFLVSFDDIPEAPDAALEDTSPEPALDTGAPEASADVEAGTPVPITPACDTSFPLESVEGCASFLDNAQVCADNAKLTAYPADRTTDVVTCSKSGATCVRHCVACAHNPQGFPDQCDQCVGKPDGTYCGTDMGWQPQNFRLLVRCTGGRITSVMPCDPACDSRGGAGDAACKS